MRKYLISFLVVIIVGSAMLIARTYENISPVGREINLRKKPALPPNLTVEVSFSESSGNDMLDAEETGTFKIIIKNDGRGKAMDVIMNISPSKLGFRAYNISGLSFYNTKKIGDINPGKEKKIIIPITADFAIISKQISLDFTFTEANNFEPDGAKYSFYTKSFSAPDLVIVPGFIINDPNGNGMIETAEVVKITALIQNIGQGIAKDVKIKLSKGENISWGEIKNQFWIGDLLPGEHRQFTFDLFANNKATTEIPVFVSITESRGRYGKERIKLDLKLKKRMAKMKNYELIAKEEDKDKIKKQSGYRIDVEEDIPNTKMENDYGVAVIIGNRDYGNDIPMVDFAIRDATYIKEYLIKTLGYREGNIIYYENATLATLKKAFVQIKNIYREQKSDIFIYYSGHGAPDQESNQPYFVPIDADPNYIKDMGYAVNDLYELLNELDAKSNTVVIDACFSGRSENGMIIKDASPVSLKVENTFLLDENSAVLTSATGTQLSSWYREMNHSLFTYYFLKALKGEADLNGNNQLTISEIESYIGDSVPYMARRIRNTEQTPQVDAFNKDRVLVVYR